MTYCIVPFETIETKRLACEEFQMSCLSNGANTQPIMLSRANEEILINYT